MTTYLKNFVLYLKQNHFLNVSGVLVIRAEELYCHVKTVFNNTIIQGGALLRREDEQKWTRYAALQGWLAQRVICKAAH